jgi:hypothetical protein
MGPIAIRRRRYAYRVSSIPSRQLSTKPGQLHASWLNQIELWLSLLSRKLLRHGNFRSVADPQAQVLAFITSYNRTMAKPFAWTYDRTAPAKPRTA